MPALSALSLLFAASAVVATTVFLRLLYILPATSPFRSKQTKRPKDAPSHVVIVLGSGGHTAEMISLIRDIDPRRYIHRTYIVSSGDNFSSSKALETEKVIQSKHRKDSNALSKAGQLDADTGTWDIKTVPRARKIHQTLYATPFSCLQCIIGCLQALRSTARSSKASPGQYPDIIITNGPATAVIVIFAAAVLKFFGAAPVWKMKTIYVESWARVKTLSLSGKVLLRMGICHRFLVQWEALAKAINGEEGEKKVEWVGFLVE